MLYWYGSDLDVQCMEISSDGLGSKGAHGKYVDVCEVCEERWSLE